jgi:peptidoglycan/LPS O-acetylase OafA/YrhL
MRNRIAELDGLRAIAVLGVVWVHVWTFCSNPTWSVGKLGSINLDLNRAIAILGQGVDLFFVISGFCMYLIYASKQNKFRLKEDFFPFLKKRWLRIAPAFYLAAIVCAFRYPFIGQPFPWLDLIAHASFTHIWIPNTVGLAAPFWSLATEWHFYLFLPFFIWGVSRYGFWTAISMTIISSIGFRLWMYTSPLEVQIFWKAQLPSRLVEFAGGICIAKLYVDKKIIPKFLSAEKGFLLALVITYCGRILMVAEVIKFAGHWGYVCQVFAEPILTLGYSLILWNVIGSTSIFSKALSCKALSAIGLWSYSMYLWHWYPCLWISVFLKNQFGSSTLLQYISLLLCLILLIPISWLSYTIIEAPYFRYRSQKLS